jgi:pyruvate dehydrogenase E2 component (dihydrolipoamide acetyltransferase)
MICRRFAELPPHVKLGMPALSPTMTTGKIVRWLKKEGEKVKAGEVMLEVETDKSTLGYEVQDDTFLARILAEADARPLELGTPIAILVDKADRIAAFKEFKVESEGKKEEKKEEKKEDKKEEHLRMSPAALVMAEELKINPEKITPTGPRGLILKEDVVKYAEEHKGSAEKDKKQESLPKSEKKIEKQSGNVEKKVGVVKTPRFTVSMQISIDETLKLFGKEKLNAFLIRAAAATCDLIPEANSKFFPDFTRFYSYFDLQIFNYSSGHLQNFYIPDCHLKRIDEISSLLKSESRGPHNFAVSFGSLSQEVATPENTALLSIGPEESLVVSAASGLRATKVLGASLSLDHRAVDGAVGASWLKQFKSFVENPVSLL